MTDLPDPKSPEFITQPNPWHETELNFIGSAAINGVAGDISDGIDESLLPNLDDQGDSERRIPAKYLMYPELFALVQSLPAAEARKALSEGLQLLPGYEQKPERIFIPFVGGLVLPAQIDGADSFEMQSIQYHADDSGSIRIFLKLLRGSEPFIIAAHAEEFASQDEIFRGDYAIVLTPESPPVLVPGTIMEYADPNYEYPAMALKDIQDGIDDEVFPDPYQMSDTDCASFLQAIKNSRENIETDICVELVTIRK